MQLMEIIKARHSIRKYTEEQIAREDLEKILEAGTFAPNAGGGQRSMMVAVYNKELTARLGAMNMAKFDRSHLAGSYVSKEQPSTIDDPTIKNGFYAGDGTRSCVLYHIAGRGDICKPGGQGAS